MTIKSSTLTIAVLSTLLFLPITRAQTIDQGIASLAGKLSSTLIAKGKKKVVVSDFSDLEGRPTELGRFLSEQLSVELVNAPGLSVMDRANLKNILAEHKLNESGLVNPESAKKLGQFLGVDVILVGTVISLDEDVSVTVKAISTETAEITAASKATFPKTAEMQQLLFRSVETNASVSTVSRNQPPEGLLEMKDIGDCRVSLKSVKSAEVSNPWGATVSGIRCVLEITNRNLNHSAIFAVNGENTDGGSPPGLSARSRLTDLAGNMWVLYEIVGLGIIRAGNGDRAPAIIDAIRYGKHTPHGWDPRAHSRTWHGDLTYIPAGESISITVDYGPNGNTRDQTTKHLENIQFQCELVAALGISGSQSGDIDDSTLRLHNLVWDNIRFSR
jgi:TolB-like protein